MKEVFFKVIEYEYSSYSYSGIQESSITYFKTRKAAEEFLKERIAAIPPYAKDVTPVIEEEVFSD